MPGETYEAICTRIATYFGDAAGQDGRAVPDEATRALGVFAGLYREGFRLAGKQVHVFGTDPLAAAIAACLMSGGAAGVTTGGAEAIPQGGAAYYILTDESPEHRPAATELPGAEGVCDLTVTPALRSRLLLDAEEADLLTCGGVYPLAAAIGIARGRLTGRTPEPNEVETAVRRYLRAHSNITVTGLRGEGAEVVAEALSHLTRRRLVRVGRGEVGEIYRHWQPGQLFLAEEGIAADREALLPVEENGRCVLIAPPLDTVRDDPARGAGYREVLGTYTAFCDRTYEYTGDPAETARRIFDDFLREPYLKRSR